MLVGHDFAFRDDFPTTSVGRRWRYRAVNPWKIQIARDIRGALGTATPCPIWLWLGGVALYRPQRDAGWDAQRYGRQECLRYAISFRLTRTGPVRTGACLGTKCRSWIVASYRPPMVVPPLA